jgi:hypothetical protein
VGRQLFPDRGTSNNDQVDRRQPGKVIERMRSSSWGVHQLGRALVDHASGERIRAVSATGEPVALENGDGAQLVTDNWLRQTFPPPGRPVAPAAPDTAHERYMAALAKMGDAMDAVDRAVRRLVGIEGVDGRRLIETEGVEPGHADAWMEDLMKLIQRIPVWRATHVARHGAGDRTSASDWDDTTADDEDEDDLESEEGWEDEA